MKIFEIENYLNEILEPWNYTDYCYNGIQIEGRHEVKKVAVGVSFNKAFIDHALEERVDMLLVHHGIFGSGFFSLKGYIKRRVEKVIKNDLTLMGYHLPLDAHREYGNNATILKLLGLEPGEQVEVGYIGEYEEAVSFDDFYKRLKQIFPNQPILKYVNSDFVKKVCVISGGAAGDLRKVEGKVDTFITGEVKEQTRDEAREMGINFINAGHYATETFGVKNLGKLLEENLGLEVVFIDVWNEV
ncbi:MULTISPECIES: Nif3-like dinuclear metal center hexameric protein [Kosmotoga]|uniref:Nif3-like dinuclear metal center hexameric protein n=1 Tax=Kosmotoga olearia (strain ATCC BAA-1733 / DSM 21960 / TBF 19.5.1) TaxID=521045 RepID=C5CDX0_KOSOT|nr:MULTISPECIES: Nif3-like dinuclear metal center hexameric protein [Kosmotoga]ACR79139.1 protein of unknown function DUF34 [Kosmotoga olearia TBF 19.5.1]MDI3524566.1 hypothetical protein [Kosmotoga sp.]